ncbi:RNA-binding cell elongation regulator Jag/EloR [Thermodesulfobacteriota bacterium]
MGIYEFEGKSTEEAIKNAALELNIPEEELDIDIIEPGSAGIFGLVGTRRAKVQVTIQNENTNGLNEAIETLEDILALIPVDTTVTGEKTDGKIDLIIEGDTSGLLIGRKGKTLDALQYIVNKAANKKSEKKVKVVIDSENYRQRRIESLKQLAIKMGAKAKKIKKPVATNPLNPHDRRIVHITLKEVEGIDTRSRGDGLLKKVVIIPKK